MQDKTLFRYFCLLVIPLQLTSLTMGQEKQMNEALELGDFKILKLQDTQTYLSTSYLFGIEHEEATRVVGSDSSLTPVNAYLVRTPNHVVLVDAGVGKNTGENSGHLQEQLKEAGVDPADIDLVLITHFHFDHIGGLLSSNGKRLFPNATIRASQVESDFWLGDSTSVPENLRERAGKIEAIFEPYRQANAFQPFLPNEALGNGIKALPAYGHTPGHTVFSFSSKGQELWCIGDLIHFSAIQFEHPSVAIVFDSDREMAVDTRKEFFQQATKKHIILAGGHLPEMVQLEAKGETFVAEPISNR